MFPNLTKTLGWVVGWVSHIWENFKKKFSFGTFPHTSTILAENQHGRNLQTSGFHLRHCQLAKSQPSSDGLMTKLCRTFLLSPSCRHIWKRKPPSDVPVTSLSGSFATARDCCSWLLGRPQLWDIFAFSSTIIRFLEHLAIMGLAAYMIAAIHCKVDRVSRRRSSSSKRCPLLRKNFQSLQTYNKISNYLL